MSGGSLFEVIHVGGREVGLKRSVLWGRDVGKGLGYLHGLGVVHRDVKSGNCLIAVDGEVGDREKVVIGDLDLCVRVGEDYGVGGGMDVDGDGERIRRVMECGPSNGRLRFLVGTVVYMAPEVLKGGFGGFEGDVYAFGILLNEILTGTVPYVDRKLPVPELHTVLESRFNEVKLRKAIVGGLRPVLVERVPEILRDLIRRCWDGDQGKRPRMAEIVEVLEKVCEMSEEELEGFGWICGGVKKGSDGGTRDGEVSAEDVRRELGKLQELANKIPAPNESAIVALRMHSTHDSSYEPIINAGLSSTSGKRGEDRMEDRSTIAKNVHGCTLLAVYDGHGGAACAEFASRTLPLRLYHSWCFPDATFRKSLMKAFLDTDRLFLHNDEFSDDDSGTTALVSLITGNRLYVANAGDCRAILGKGDGSVVQLTNDHIVHNLVERAAVEQRGAKLINGRVQGRMMVTRALGDRVVKQYISAEPEISEIELTPDDEFLVMASDGLWDVISTEMAADLVRSTVRVPDMSAKRLALKAIELGSGDNISVIVAFLTPVSNMMYVADSHS